MVRQARWVSSMFGKFRHVVFSLWFGRCVELRCVELRYGALSYVTVRQAGLVSCGKSMGVNYFRPTFLGRQGELCLVPFWYVG